MVDLETKLEPLRIVCNLMGGSEPSSEVRDHFSFFGVPRQCLIDFAKVLVVI